MEKILVRRGKKKRCPGTGSSARRNFFNDVASNRTNERTCTHTRTHTHTQIHMQTQTQIQRARHTLNDPTTCLFLSFSRAALGLSPWGDINCLLPNLIRNFRRRGNLTSFLFSLARSRARCWRGSRSQDFSIHDRSRVGSNQTTGHPRSNLINLYRCVTCSSLSLSLSLLSLIVSFSLSPLGLHPRLTSFDDRDERKIESSRERDRDKEREREIYGVTVNCQWVE